MVIWQKWASQQPHLLKTAVSAEGKLLPKDNSLSSKTVILKWRWNDIFRYVGASVLRTPLGRSNRVELSVANLQRYLTANKFWHKRVQKQLIDLIMVWCFRSSCSLRMVAILIVSSLSVHFSHDSSQSKKGGGNESYMLVDCQNRKIFPTNPSAEFWSNTVG